ncbi:unnamed protein product [Moneuplotes crassus]|uniref:Large ribosomal subunit protein bL21m n=1 Tax=Euplotes crassus TaxID=5936 RepID=A0AAD1XV99_EUPCR|nr:unnamed protein product [Moneuplotes crassus]
MFLRTRLFNPLWKSTSMMANCIRPSVTHVQFFAFSAKSEDAADIDWDAIDSKSIKKLTSYHMESKLYSQLSDQWKKPLAKKQATKARRLEREAKREPMPEEDQKLVVHDGVQQITYPQDPYGIFAIVQIAGKQYKVTKDSTVLLEKTPFSVGDQIVIEQVVMIGTKEYTSIGRPFIETAKVYATIEEESRTEKVIIFKKKRRKTYQKNKGHRQTIHGIRIDGIEHTITQDLIQ